MIAKILAATDFSTPGDEAARQAEDLALRLGAELVLLHITTPPDPPTSTSLSSDAAAKVSSLLEEIHAEAEQKLEALAKELGASGVTVTQRVEIDHPDVAIPRVAADLGADLAVVGTQGRTAVQRFLMGSTAERVTRLSEVPVLVARPPPREGRTFRRVLVPVDFSDASERAIVLAAALAAPDATLDLFHAGQSPFTVVGLRGAASTARVQVQEELQAEVHTRLENLCVKHQRGEQTLRATYAQGSATPRILEHLESGDPYDLVALGSHGERGFRRRVLGSVAERIARHAPCSVLIARATSEVEGA